MECIPSGFIKRGQLGNPQTKLGFQSENHRTESRLFSNCVLFDCRRVYALFFLGDVRGYPKPKYDLKYGTNVPTRWNGSRSDLPLIFSIETARLRSCYEIIGRLCSSSSNWLQLLSRLGVWIPLAPGSLLTTGFSERCVIQFLRRQDVSCQAWGVPFHFPS